MAHRKLQHRLARDAIVLALCVSAGIPLRARAVRAVDPTAGVSLKVLNSRAPPGGAIQLTVTLTEPKPILTSWIGLTFTSVGSVMGAALFSPAGALSDVAGTAVIGNGQLTVRTTSPSAQLGTGAGVPVLTVAIGVPP